MSIYARLLKPFLFSLDAERAHELILGLLSSGVGAGALRLRPSPRNHARLSQQIFGLDFSNPVGLAAGLDKQGTAVPAWHALGFGFAEVGTVTPKPQPGNPRPRLFRLPADHAIINRFGFNSDGAERVAAHLRRHSPTSLRLGINVGKNKETPNDRAVDDYVRSVEILHPHAHYFVVNVSSPNTAGLRDLQESRALRALLTGVTTAARRVPVLVKVSPDMDTADLRAAVDAAVEGGAAGIVATNTTIKRTGLQTRGDLAAESGGLSGQPLNATAHETCRLLYRHFAGRVPIVGVGGIMTAEDAYRRIRAGASLVQLYTALIYQGPGLVTTVADGIAARLARDGFTNVRDAIGVDAN